MEGVQRFGEKRALRRKMPRFCLLGVRSPNRNWQWLQGQIASEIAWRKRGLGLAGGAKGIRTGGTITFSGSVPPVATYKFEPQNHDLASENSERQSVTLDLVDMRPSTWRWKKASVDQPARSISP
jgi:hypothetical protein